MIHLRRVKPFVQVFAALALLTAVVNALLSLLAATPVLGWLPKAVSGTGFLEDNRDRVANALVEYTDGKVEPERHLAAIVGISNVREDIDLKTVADEVGTDWHILGLGGAGLGMSDIAQHANTILNSGLRPDVVVLGFGLQQLVDARPQAHALDAGLLEYVRRGDVRNVVTSLRGALWAYTRRQDVSLATDSALFDARARLFRAFAVELPRADAERHSPWREMIKSDWPDHFSAATLREEERFFEELGVFDLRGYTDSPRAISGLIDLIRRFEEHGAKVILLLMPEHPRLQQRIPSDATQTLRASLLRAFPHESPPTIDLLSSVDETGFVDLAHLNHGGSLLFSRLLAARLRKQLPTGPSLMSAHARRAGTAAPTSTHLWVSSYERTGITRAETKRVLPIAATRR